MNETKFNKTQVIKYLIFTFAIVYIVQIGASVIYNSGNKTVGTLLISVMMLAPVLGVLLSGAKLKGMGWRPQIRKNLKHILIAWFTPIILTALGAALYFLILPGHFDQSGGYIAAVGGEEAVKQLEEQGVAYPLYVMSSVLSGVFYAPLINTVLALGEEIGWRGFLYPQLKERFGRKKGWIIGGVIWGAFHWPIIWLIGYEYGAYTGNPSGYFGAPVVGMLLFCVITTGWGILHDRLYEKSGSIWTPALFHGAINAAASLPFILCLTDTGSARLLGPAPMGIISGLPFLAAAAVILLRRNNDPEDFDEEPELEEPEEEMI